MWDSVRRYPRLPGADSRLELGDLISQRVNLVGSDEKHAIVGAVLDLTAAQGRVNNVTGDVDLVNREPANGSLRFCR